MIEGLNRFGATHIEEHKKEMDTMDKQRVIAHVSCMLNRGMATAAETSHFADRPHDQLVERLGQYLNLHQPFLADIHLERSHALNEKGVDLLLTAFGARIGFQIKSHFDVTEGNFNANVKRQLAESRTHGLDKYYVLVCCPIANNGNQYGLKISTLINDLSVMKTDYHCAYGPESAVKLFDGTAALSQPEFAARIKQYTYEPTDWNKLIDELYSRIAGQAGQAQHGAAVLDHDRHKFSESNAIMSETDLKELLDKLYGDHSYRNDRMNKLEAFHHFFQLEDNRFITPELMKLCDDLRASVRKVLEFTASEFFTFPTNQMDRYCLAPSLHVDRADEVVSESGHTRYSDLTMNLNNFIEEIDQRYLDYRRRVKELLAV